MSITERIFVGLVRLRTQVKQAAQGMDRNAAKQQAELLLAKVGLTADAATRAGRYSGGMRRRLSVAIALLGALEI